MNPLNERIEGFSEAQNSYDTEGLSPALVTLHDPFGSASEAYRMLRTNIFYARIDAPPKVVVVTSANPQEGKSITCANLGVALAQVNKSVLLLDCDLRRPVQHKLFGLHSSPGLVDVLIGNNTLQEVSQEPVPGLKVVTAGYSQSNPAEVLSSRRFAEFLDRSRRKFDYVLLDTPPVRLVSDPSILARYGDGVLMVLNIQETSKKTFRQAMKILNGVRASLIGTVTNKVDLPEADKNYRYAVEYYKGS